MDLLEYQAKELFRQMGIPILPAQRIYQPKDLKDLKIPYPVVLKSQVYTGGRGKAGGIKFVENTIDAVAAAQTIFHLPIMGSRPDVLLAEARYEAEREFYLAVVLDSSTRRPVLLGSQFGGIEVDTKLDQMQLIVVDQEFSPFYARRLALKMGLEGKLIRSVTAIVEKMYALFVQRDLDLIEINPLAIDSNGNVMALDGKVTVNDAALKRHPILTEFVTQMPQRNGRNLTLIQDSPRLNLVELEGDIGLLCNGAGLTMATLDLIRQANGKPASYVDLGGDYHNNYLPVAMQEYLEQGLELMTQNRGVKVVLVNILSGLLTCDQIAQVIVRFLKRQVRQSHLPKLIIRLMGDRLTEATTLLAESGIPAVERLDDAIAKAVALT